MRELIIGSIGVLSLRECQRQHQFQRQRWIPNISSLANPLISAYTKFLGIKKLDMLVTGSGADAFNNNKFTMARIGMGPDSDNGDPNAEPTAFSQITGSAKAHMLGAVYVRNGDSAYSPR